MIYIVILAVIFYSFRTAFMFLGSSRERAFRKPANKDYRPFVSVIVPARNEENNIASCVESLASNTYPSNLFEIIIIDDRSTDSTSNILKELLKKHANLKIITIKNDGDKNLKGKPGALQAGIDISKGEILLMTDADCIVGPKWVETIVGVFSDPVVDLVPSYTLIKAEGAFNTAQATEWIYMHTMACAGLGWNQPLGCYGNNLSIRKETYNKIGGYASIKFSVTEDLALETAVFNSGSEVRYVCDPDAAVSTLPCADLKEYINQHRRWAIGGLDLGFRAAIFVVTSFAMWLGLAVSIYSGNLLWIGALLFCRIAGDYAVTIPAAKILNQKQLKTNFVLSVFFFMLIELIIPFTILKREVKWKGQIFGR